MAIEIKRGLVKEVDLMGTAIDNFNRIAPAVKVIVLEGDGWDSGWLPVATPKCDSGGNYYLPMDIDAEVSIACPAGGIEQAVVVGALSRVPDEAGTTAEDRKKHAIMKFGDLLILMNRQEGEEEYTITIPGSASGQHLLTLRRKIDSRGIVIQTAGGHTLTLQDLEADKKVELSHSSGSRITFERDGSFTIVVAGGMTTLIDGDRETTVGGDDTLGVDGNRKATIGGDDTLTVGGDQEITVMRTIKYTATGTVEVTGSFTTINGLAGIDLKTLTKIVSGIVTQLTHPVCYVTGAPIGGSMTVKAEA